MVLRSAWDDNAERWIAWARTPGHDSYWRFHRDAFLPLVPPPAGLTVDVGCGEGRVSRDLVAAGHRVVALDASVQLARAAADGGTGPVTVADAARLPFPDACADCAVAFMSLQDVDDFGAAIDELARILVPGGILAMAVVHPVNSAGCFEGDSDDLSRPFVIRESWFERRLTHDTCGRAGLVMEFHSEHRSLEDYTEALASAGFVIERLREVRDPDAARVWFRMPLFIDLRARRA